MAVPVGQTASQGTPVTSAPTVAPVPRDTSAWGGWSQQQLDSLAAQAILNGIGVARPSTGQTRMVVAWIRAEQPDFLHVNDNPLNTTLNPAAGRIAGGGTQGNIDIFDTIAHGVSADVQTLQNHPPLVAALRAGNVPQFQAALGASGWGTSPSLWSQVYNGLQPADYKLLQPGGSALLQQNAAQKAVNDPQGTNSPTGDLYQIPVVGQPLATTIGAAGSMLDVMKEIGSFLTDTHNYLRIGESALGTVLLVLGVVSLIKGRSGLALVAGIAGYTFLYGGVKDVRPIDEIKGAFGG